MQTWRYPLPLGGSLVLTLDCSGALAKLARLEERIENPRPLLEAWAEDLRVSFGRQFAQGGDPAWRALAASTVAAKRGQGLPARTKSGKIPKRLLQNGRFGADNILIATGALRDSYRQLGAKGHVERIDLAAGTVFVGSALRTPDGRYSLARLHQQGTAPYEIRARVAKALRFSGRGSTIFRRAVRHPGVAARPVRLTPADRTLMQQQAAAFLRGRALARPTSS